MVLPRTERLATRERIKKRAQAIKADRTPVNTPPDLAEVEAEGGNNGGSGE